MNESPLIGYAEIHDRQMPHCGTVFVTLTKSRWTWDFNAQKPLAFWENSRAHYANYCCKRRMNRLARHRHTNIQAAPVISCSSRNECVSVPKLNENPELKQL